MDGPWAFSCSDGDHLHAQPVIAHDRGIELWPSYGNYLAFMSARRWHWERWRAARRGEMRWASECNFLISSSFWYFLSIEMLLSAAAIAAVLVHSPLKFGKMTLDRGVGYAERVLLSSWRNLLSKQKRRRQLEVSNNNYNEARISGHILWCSYFAVCLVDGWRYNLFLRS